MLLQVKGEVNLTGKGHEEQMAKENLSNSLRLEMMFNDIVRSFFSITILTRKTGLRLVTELGTLAKLGYMPIG